jgi:hypothetical protein
MLTWLYTMQFFHRDALDRGLPGALTALLVAFAAWPLSLLFWFKMRPEKVKAVRRSPFKNRRRF